MGEWETVKPTKKKTSIPVTPSKAAPSQNFGSFSAFNDLKVEKENKRPTTKSSNGDAAKSSSKKKQDKTAVDPRIAKTVLFNNPSKISANSNSVQQAASKKKPATLPKPAKMGRSQKQVKQTNSVRIQKVPAQSKGIFRGRNFLLAGLAYVLFHWAFTCASFGFPPKANAPGICRGIHDVEHVWWKPNFHRAVNYASNNEHARTVKKHYDEKLRPHVNYVVDQGYGFYETYGIPAQTKAQKAYLEHVDPHVQKVHKSAHKEYTTRYNNVKAKVSKLYAQHAAAHVDPVINVAHGIYIKHVYPIYLKATPAAEAAYNHVFYAYGKYVEPIAGKSFVAAQDVWTNRVSPLVVNTWTQHGRPYFDLLLVKVGLVKETKSTSFGTKVSDAASDAAAAAQDAIKSAKKQTGKAQEAVQAKTEDAKNAAKEKLANAKKSAEQTAEDLKRAAKDRVDEAVAFNEKNVKPKVDDATAAAKKKAAEAAKKVGEAKDSAAKKAKDAAATAADAAAAKAKSAAADVKAQAQTKGNQASAGAAAAVKAAKNHAENTKRDAVKGAKDVKEAVNKAPKSK